MRFHCLGCSEGRGEAVSFAFFFFILSGVAAESRVFFSLLFFSLLFFSFFLSFFSGLQKGYIYVGRESRQ